MADLQAAEPMQSTTIDTDTTTIPGTVGGALDPTNTPENAIREELAKQAEAAKEAAKADKQADKAIPEETAKADDKAGKVDPKAEEKAVKPDKDDAKPAEAKDEKPAKERAPDGKFAKAAEAEVDDAEAGEPAEKAGKDGKPVEYPNAPKNFTPEAKERWANVPRSVRRDIEVMTQDYDRAIEHYRGHAERYEQIRQYDELARSNGRDLTESLQTLAKIEDDLRANPIRALQMVLNEAGPRTQDGRPLSIMQVAQFIVQNGEEGLAKVMQAGQQQEQPKEDPRIAQLQQQLVQVQTQQVTATVIEPFKAEHPRFEELREDIAFFLKSDKINPSLAPAERLSIAYDMAARLNPTSEAQTELREQVPEGRVVTSGGEKSIKSTPGSVSREEVAPASRNISDILRAEMTKRKFA